MTNSNNTATATVRFPGLFALTFLVLLVLKLTGAAALSWFVVFLPLIVGFVLTVLFLMIVLVLVFFKD